jgi:hypothetical protein
MLIDVFVDRKMGTHNAHMHKKQYQAISSMLLLREAA